jgi:hypothetical protein
MSSQRLEVDRAGEIRPGSETISKVEEGSTGTQESLPSPYEKRFKKDLATPKNPDAPKDDRRLGACEEKDDTYGV